MSLLSSDWHYRPTVDRQTANHQDLHYLYQLRWSTPFLLLLHQPDSSPDKLKTNFAGGQERTWCLLAWLGLIRVLPGWEPGRVHTCCTPQDVPPSVCADCATTLCEADSISAPHCACAKVVMATVQQICPYSISEASLKHDATFAGARTPFRSWLMCQKTSQCTESSKHCNCKKHLLSHATCLWWHSIVKACLEPISILFT